jgi:hypothetical protein
VRKLRTTLMTVTATTYYRVVRDTRNKCASWLVFFSSCRVSPLPELDHFCFFFFFESQSSITLFHLVSSFLSMGWMGSASADRTDRSDHHGHLPRGTRHSRCSHSLRPFGKRVLFPFPK